MAPFAPALRLRSRHGGVDRATQTLEDEFLNDAGEWQPLQPSLSTPGFRLYLLSLLLCQHFYLVANARERALPIQQVEAHFTVLAGGDWIIEEVQGNF